MNEGVQVLEVRIRALEQLVSDQEITITKTSKTANDLDFILLER
jgi:hypothetical protein